MQDRLTKNRSPIPAVDEVAEWGRQLDEVAASCASVKERENLRNGYHNVDFVTAVTTRFELGAEQQNAKRLIEIIGKLIAAKHIVNRIHAEDKA